MKINDHDAIGTSKRPGEAPGVSRAQGGRRGAPQPAQAGGDRVSLSEEARALSRAGNEIRVAGGVRTEKVEALREKIERGEYHVDLKAVAQKFLQSIFGTRTE